jgi:hypothetical protein
MTHPVTITGDPPVGEVIEHVRPAGRSFPYREDENFPRDALALEFMTDFDYQACRRIDAVIETDGLLRNQGLSFDDSLADSRTLNLDYRSHCLHPPLSRDGRLDALFRRSVMRIQSPC